jgi:hypothetical protein
MRLDKHFRQVSSYHRVYVTNSLGKPLVQSQGAHHTHASSCSRPGAHWEMLGRIIDSRVPEP